MLPALRKALAKPACAPPPDRRLDQLKAERRGDDEDCGNRHEGSACIPGNPHSLSNNEASGKDRELQYVNPVADFTKIDNWRPSQERQYSAVVAGEAEEQDSSQWCQQTM